MSYPPIRLQFSSKTVSFFSGISSGFYYSAFLSCWLSVKQSHQSNAPIKSNHSFTPPASPNSPFPSSFTTSVTVWSIFIRLTSSSLLFFFCLIPRFSSHCSEKPCPPFFHFLPDGVVNFLSADHASNWLKASTTITLPWALNLHCLLLAIPFLSQNHSITTSIPLSLTSSPSLLPHQNPNYDFIIHHKGEKKRNLNISYDLLFFFQL